MIYDDIPDKKGKINIYPEIIDGNLITISVIGDPEGLKYLASLLTWLAEFDQNKNNDPIGSREHLHLLKDEELDWHSCEVEICRADAKGTGEYPDFMKK